jgi:hypothetical protein
MYKIVSNQYTIALIVLFTSCILSFSASAQLSLSGQLRT